MCYMNHRSMNRSEILDCLRNLIQSKFNISEGRLLDVTTNLQDATKNSIVFYNIRDGEKSLDLFYSRVKSVDFGILIINKVPEKLSNKENILVINQDDFLLAQKTILDRLFPIELGRFKIVGVTGTNGKTTVVNLAMQISTLLGHSACSIGTIGVYNADGKIDIEIGNTTPSYVELRKIIYKVSENHDVAFCEVSSHALDQDRMYDLKLDVAGWTNFTQDHLDYHETMEDYFQAKCKIFKNSLKPTGSFIVPYQQKKLIGNILNEMSDSSVKLSVSNDAGDKHEMPLFYHADFNKSNLELALALNSSLWKLKDINLDLKKIHTPRGRFSIIEFDKKVVVIDYAHTPDALKNVIESTKDGFPASNVKVLFGCGGDRDKSKRCIMGKVASNAADSVIVTSDNPRTEDPDEIISDILQGLKNHSYEKITDRKSAIEKSLSDLKDGDILIIAGKGHEEYQEVNGVKYPFSDFEVAESCIKKLRDKK